jgi:hypothetical protein
VIHYHDWVMLLVAGALALPMRYGEDLWELNWML